MLPRPRTVDSKDSPRFNAIPAISASVSWISVCSGMVEAPASASFVARRPPHWTAHANWFTPAASLFCCLAIWEAAVRYFQVPVYLIPAPSLIAEKLVAAYPLFVQETLHSVAAIIIGFVLAAAVGIPAATLMIYSAWFRRSIYPILLTAQVLPKVALAPLFIVWFGFGLLRKC